MTDELIELIANSIASAPPSYDPADDYPPKGTPEACLLLVMNNEQFLVLGHTGRFFHGSINCAGYNGEEIGIQNVPDEHGYWVMEDGGVYCDEDTAEVSGNWRPAILNDFIHFEADLPVGFAVPDDRDFNKSDEHARYHREMAERLQKQASELGSELYVESDHGSFVDIRCEHGSTDVFVKAGDQCIGGREEIVDVNVLAATLCIVRNIGYRAFIEQHRSAAEVERIFTEE